MGEDARVAIRGVRRDANAQLDKLYKDKAVAEDEVHRLKDEAQKLTDKHVAKVDELLKKKEAEILEV